MPRPPYHTHASNPFVRASNQNSSKKGGGKEITKWKRKGRKTRIISKNFFVSRDEQSESYFHLRTITLFVNTLRRIAQRVSRNSAHRRHRVINRHQVILSAFPSIRVILTRATLLYRFSNTEEKHATAGERQQGLVSGKRGCHQPRTYHPSPWSIEFTTKYRFDQGKVKRPPHVGPLHNFMA